MTDSRLDIVIIGPCPKNPSFFKGGVHASVLGHMRALASLPEVKRVTCISIPLEAEPGTPVTTAMIEGIEVTFLTTPNRFVASCVFHVPRAIRAVRALGNPVVHVHSNGVFQVAVCLLLKLRRIPFVWTLHGMVEKETRENFRQQPNLMNALRYIVYSLTQWTTLKVAPEIFVDTPYVKEQVKTRKPVHVVPIGIFTQEFAPLRGAVRTAPIVLSLGVIDARKGHHLTVEAFAQVRNAIPMARLIIAGSLTIPSYLDQIKASITEHGLNDSVELLIDRPRSEIIAWLGRARVLALHSREESQGIALCEALASGVPVVATRIGGIPYVVTEGVDGFLVPYGDISGFAAAICRLLEDDSLHQRMSQQGIILSERFDWKGIARQMAEVYRRVAASSVKRA